MCDELGFLCGGGCSDQVSDAALSSLSKKLSHPQLPIRSLKEQPLEQPLVPQNPQNLGI